MYKKAIPLLKQLSVKLLLATLLFTSIAPPISHAIITNGSDAINLLGQYDDNLTDPGPIYTKGPANNAPHRLGFDFDHDSTRGMVIDETNHRLFVSDTNNNRVLVYDLNPDNSISDRIPDYVLGQPNFYTNTAATTQAGMNIPTGVTYDATNNLLFVAQAGAHRVTVYDVAEITNGENAINVLGQANFTSSGAATTQAGMHTPQDVAYDPTNDRLFVSQVGNHRVTVYDVSTITNGENAINVIGQSAYGNLSALTTQTGMNAPRGLAFDDTNQRLFVAQTGNHRVTVYDVTAITNGEAATHVLGQADFTSSVLATTASSMRRPYGLAYDDTNERLFISSYDSARVTVFDVTTIDNNENATHVLGVANFTTNGTGTTIATTYGPRGLAYNSSNQHLFVAQGLNHRISIFDVTAIGNGENAVDLLGQYDDNLEDPSPNYLVSLPNNTANSLGLNLNHASNKGVALDSVNHRLFVADTENHRVLVYNLNPDNTLIDRIPDKVLGQINFKNNASAVSQSRMTSPTGLAYDPINNRLFVANANRVTVYDVATITNGEAATHVLGQLDFNSGGSATTQARLNSPQGLALGNSRLYVTDTGNNRVLLFNISPASISNGQNALSVLGQPNFTTSGADNTNVKMNNPRDVAYDVANQRLFVAQAGNHRVSVFDVVSTTTGEAAVNILGQPSFASTSASNTASGMSQPYGVTYDSDSDRLFVAQSGNHRVTVYDTTEITDGEAAINILGQTSFLTATSGTTISKLNQPRGVAYDPINKSLFVAESGNNRIMLFDAGAPVIDFSLTETGGSTAVTENTTTDTFDIVLTAQPATDVVFTITSDTPTAASVSHDTITFTNGNWSTPQTITVSAPEDDNVVSENAVITISIDTDLSDNDWLAVADQTVTVTVTDNDTPNFSLTETGGSTAVTENTTTDTFDIVLTAQPATDVVFTITSDTPTAASVSHDTITFTNGNWSTPQTITVSAPEDDNVVSENAVITISIDTDLSDNDWLAVADQTVTVTVTDNDTPNFSLTETGGSTAVTENTTTDTFDIVLTAQPATDVVFTITSDTPTAASVSHDTITFTNGNWSTPQTITVSAPEDDNVVSENAVITISIDTDLSDNDWLAVADQTVTVAVTDTTVAPPPSGGGLIPILILDSTPPTTENESDGTDSEPEYELSETTFSDIISHWGGLHIIMIEKKCGAEGYYYQDENGLYVRDFKPDHDMSRAEFVKIILECKDFKFDPNDKVETPYSDVAETDWFAPYLAEAHKIGIIDGYADGAFRPNAPITREEALKTVLLIQFEEADITADTTNQASPFLDVPTTEWFSQYVIYAYIKNFITGYTTYDGTPTNIFGVGNNITRAEGAKMITKTLNL